MIVATDTTVTVTLSLSEAQALKRFIGRAARGLQSFVGPVPADEDEAVADSIWEIFDAHKIYMDGH